MSGAFHSSPTRSSLRLSSEPPPHGPADTVTHLPKYQLCSLAGARAGGWGENRGEEQAARGFEAHNKLAGFCLRGRESAKRLDTVGRCSLLGTSSLSTEATSPAPGVQPSARRPAGTPQTLADWNQACPLTLPVAAALSLGGEKRRELLGGDLG